MDVSLKKIDCFFRGSWREVYRCESAKANEVYSTNQRSCKCPHQWLQDDDRNSRVSERLSAECAAMEQEQCQRSKQVERVTRRKLTQEKEQAVLKLIAGRPGSVVEDSVEYVSETFLVTTSRFTASRMLKGYGLTRKRGTRLKLRYNADKGLQFLEDIPSSFSPLLASIDEMSVMLNVAPSYGYAPRGQRAVLSQPSRRTVSYMLTLCVCPVGILNWTLRSGSIASIFCQALSKSPEGITRLLDNARIHHATKCLTRKGLPTVAELAESKSISLKYIPAYFRILLPSSLPSTA